jgi:DNA gyrase subunit A
MLALVDNVPKILNLKQLINYFIVHRKEVVTKRTQFELKKAEERAHILEGLIIALKSIEDVIRLIKKSSSIEIARESLISSYSLTKTQAQAILDMRLQRLTSLEQERIKKEHSELLKLIEELKSILAEEQRILDIIKKELLELKEKYGDERKTEITDIEEELEIEDLIASEDQVITITHAGYIKRLSMNTYKQQRRGGKGVIAAEIREKDFVENVFIANTHSYILFFTDKGKVHWLKVYLIPEAGRQAKGKAIINLLNLEPNEKITAFIPVKEFDSEHYLILATKKGIVKKTNLIAYSNPRKGGIIAINLEQGDELIDVILTNGKQQILLATKKGNAVRFREEDARAIGRSGKGVIGIRLREDDEVIGMVDADDTKTLLTVTENGYGKRTAISEYRLINRGGSGVINIQCSERNGNVVAVKSVTDNDDIIFISRSGIIIRTPAKGISRIGRNTQGVRLMSLEQNDKVVAAARIIKE